jgi:hypothetical protein
MVPARIGIEACLCLGVAYLADNSKADKSFQNPVNSCLGYSFEEFLDGLVNLVSSRVVVPCSKCSRMVRL